MEQYHITVPSVPRIPVVISIPHCGTAFPDDLRSEYDSQLIKDQDDTDWFVDRLYSFAPDLGITMITAAYSRWVIDLNRDPDNKPLYADGRIITDICPTTTFLGVPLYRDGRMKVSAAEVDRRKELYFIPYHTRLRQLLTETKKEFGKVLLWDCHSIRQIVPTIQGDKFPDLILGSADGMSAGPALVGSALKNLSGGGYSFRHNQPFRGGYITREYGKPETGQHALQLEMTKVNYMDDREKEFSPARAENMAELLMKTLKDLADTLVSV